MMSVAASNFTALVLAGSRPGEDPFARLEGYRHKALIEVDGKPILQRVVEAVRAAGASQVFVSCNHPEVIELAQSLGAAIAPTCVHPSSSVLKSLDHGSLGPLLVTTADHALLKPAWIEQLLADCPDDADFGVMLANRSAVERALPESTRTYAKFADGEWSGCNLFLLRTAEARKMVELWQEVEVDRKRPFRIAARLGLVNLIYYLGGRLTLNQAVFRIGERVGIRAAAVSAEDGLAAVDVDKPEDLHEVRGLLSCAE